MRASIRDLVRDHFRQKASSFDSLYEESLAEGPLQRLLRPVLFLRRDVAVDAVAERPGARVLDVGSGSGRVGEALLDAGAGSYVGVDFSEPMNALARRRLARFGDRADVVTADFLGVDLERPFDVVVAVGLFDYIEDPVPFAQRISDLCNGSLVASFPKWDLLKGPARRLRYEWFNDCPIFDYTARELRFLFRAVGFENIQLDEGRTFLVMKATK